MHIYSTFQWKERRTLWTATTGAPWPPQPQYQNSDSDFVLRFLCPSATRASSEFPLCLSINLNGTGMLWNSTEITNHMQSRSRLTKTNCWKLLLLRSHVPQTLLTMVTKVIKWVFITSLHLCCFKDRSARQHRVPVTSLISKLIQTFDCADMRKTCLVSYFCSCRGLSVRLLVFFFPTFLMTEMRPRSGEHPTALPDYKLYLSDSPGTAWPGRRSSSRVQKYILNVTLLRQAGSLSWMCSGCWISLQPICWRMLMCWGLLLMCDAFWWVFLK